MSKKLKTFLVILAGIIAVAGLGVGGYFLISNLSSVTINNFKIIKDGKAINDTDVYLVSDSVDKFNIEMEIDSSNGVDSYYFTTSDSSVAKVVKIDGKLYVQYYKAGSAVITAYSGATSDVYDSFKINVYEDFVADLKLLEEINGVESVAQDNTIELYSDGTIQNTQYKATGVLKDLSCNNMLLRVVNDYDKTIFNNISIDTSINSIIFDINKIIYDSKQPFTIQSYYINNDGEDCVLQNYTYYADVIGYRIKDMQLLVCEDYHFQNNAYVYLNASHNGDPFLLEGETIVDQIYLTPEVDNIYFKTRVVYSNNTVKDVSYSETLAMVSTQLQISLTGGMNDVMDYWTAIFKDVQVDSPAQMMFADYIDLSYSELLVEGTSPQSVKYSFRLIYLIKNDDANSDYQQFVNKLLYKKDVVNNIYVYTYWDSRFRRSDAITDSEGNILDFGNGAPDCDNLE